MLDQQGRCGGPASVGQEKSGGVCGEGLGAEFEHAFYDFLQFRKVFFAGVEDNGLVGLVGFEDDTRGDLLGFDDGGVVETEVEGVGYAASLS